MIFPIKIKSLRKGNFFLHNLLSEEPSVRLRAINLVRIGKVFKTTTENRFPETLNVLKRLAKNFTNVHDIGCSDGTASLAIIKSLNYSNYFCLDKYVRLSIKKTSFGSFLADESGNLHIFENEYIYVYLDPFRLHKSLAEWMISKIFLSKPISFDEEIFLDAVNPELGLYKNVSVMNFDIFSENLKEKSDLIIIFNLLNKFNDGPMKLKVKKFADKNLNKNGILVIGENNKQEKATFYSLESKLEVIHSINGGSMFSLY